MVYTWIVRALGVFRRFTAIFAVLAGMGLVVDTANVAQANGCGVPFDGTTYSLSSPNHFTLLGACDPSKNFVLLNDIDLSGVAVAKRHSFTGTFDGRGFTISNMMVTGSAMFDVGAAGATFTRVNFANATVLGGSVQAGASGVLVGTSQGSTTISSTSFEGRVTGGVADFSKTGGLIGEFSSGSLVLTDVTFSGTVTAGSNFMAMAGGLVGESGVATSLTISRSSFDGSVTGGSDEEAAAGGLVGSFLGATLTVSNTYMTGTVTGGFGESAGAGGFIGKSYSSINVQNSYLDAQIVGGTGIASGAGGFVGISESDVVISRSYVLGSVTGGVGDGAASGGFVGIQCCQTWPITVTVTDSFVRASFTGGIVGPSRAGGIVGRRTGSSSTTTITNSYGEGNVASGGGAFAWGSVLSDSYSPTISATASFCVTVCESGGTGVGTTVSAINLVAAAQSAGWNFSSTWCASPSYNDGFPVLKGLSFGPNAAWGSCGAVSAPTPAVVPVWRVSIDTGGGSCRATSGSLTGSFIGYRYLPGAAECSRAGYVFRGWARASDPNKVIDLPLLVDPSDGVQRYFFAAGADLVAVWSAAPTPPSAMTPFVAFSNFLCDRCTTLWIIWSGAVERQTTTSRVVVTDASGTEVCTAGVVDIAPWRVCEITGLTPGSTHTYRIVVSDGGGTSAPVSTQVTLNNRRG